MDRYAQYAMVASEEAVNDAGFNFEKIDKDRELFGDQEYGLETFQIEMLNLLQEMEHQNSILSLSQNDSDIAGGHISIKY
jgi:3-oxoacyl-[acyl-carrier-protein] synthase II